MKETKTRVEGRKKTELSWSQNRNHHDGHQPQYSHKEHNEEEEHAVKHNNTMQECTHQYSLFLRVVAATRIGSRTVATPIGSHFRVQRIDLWITNERA